MGSIVERSQQILAVIQNLAAWLQGYANLTNTDANGLPYAEDHTGIGEYLSTVNYRMGAIVTSVGTSQAYISKKADNLGNALSDVASWTAIGDLASLANINLQYIGITNILLN